MTIDLQYTNFSVLGKNILLRTVDRQTGERSDDKIPLQPRLFVPSNKPSKFKDIHGRFMDEIIFESPREAKNFADKYKDVEGFTVCGSSSFGHAYIFDRFGMDLEFDSSLIKVLNFDVEVESDDGFPDPVLASKEVTAITSEINGYYTVFGCKDFNKTIENGTYIKCTDERHLLLEFITYWNREAPDVITGWNIEQFDIPYIINRINRILGDEWTKRLSPWGIVNSREVFDKFGSTFVTYQFLGLSVIDYLSIYRSFVKKPRDNFKLDTIAHVELGEKKLDYSEYGSLQKLYKEDYEKFILYNIKDTELVRRLENKLKLLDLIYMIAYSVGVNFNEAVTVVLLWDTLTHNFLLQENTVIPYERPSRVGEGIAGGFVKEPIPGLYEWEVTLDLASLYPHLIMQFNISPETILDHVGHNLGTESEIPRLVDEVLDRGQIKELGKKLNASISASGWSFSNTKQGFFPRIMEKYFKKREIFKRKMLEAESAYEHAEENGLDQEEKDRLKNEMSKYDNFQNAMKVGILNSGYGYLLNAYSKWYDPRLGSSVTLSGQMVIKWTERTINSYLNRMLKTNKDYVIAIDTDSCMISVKDLVDALLPKDAPKEDVVQFLDKAFSQKIIPEIHKAYQELAELTNSYQQKMSIKREVIADRGIHIGKKNYILNMLARESTFFTKPQLKMMGVSAIKSSSPPACRDAAKEVFEIIMSGTESQVQKYIKTFKEKFRTLPFEEVAFPRSVKNLDKYSDIREIYKSGTPIHVRGSLLFNKEVKEKRLNYESIKNGDKMIFCYLKTPNPLKENVIAAKEILPRELDLEKYIDYDQQFDVGFLNLVKKVMDIIGWHVEKKNRITDLLK